MSTLPVPKSVDPRGFIEREPHESPDEFDARADMLRRGALAEKHMIDQEFSSDHPLEKFKRVWG